METLSVIIPIYNSEQYLEICLNSLVSQTCKDFEVILVDDGSTDNSAVICKQVCSANNNFKYFYQENSGPGSARNNGIRNASGKFISFIDADDYVEPNYIETIINNMNCDVLFFGSTHHYKNGKKTSHTYSKHNDISFFNILMEQDTYWDFVYPWNKCFKRDLIVENQLFFIEDLWRAEDELFTLAYMSHVDCINTISDILYNYQIGIGVSSIYPNLEEFKIINSTIFYISNKYKDKNVSAYLKIRGINYWFNAYLYGRCNLYHSYFNIRKNLKKKEKKILKHFLKSYSYNKKITINKRTARFTKIVLSDDNLMITNLKLAWLTFYEWQKNMTKKRQHKI